MATISNTPRPGYVYDSTDAVWYPIGTGTHSHSEIPTTIVDAKGDIIAATAADTVARLAVGANDTVLTADSSTATGLKWATPAAGGMTLISETVASGNTSLSLSSIPGTYKQLMLVWHGVYVSNGDGAYAFRLNNDSGANYSITLGALTGTTIVTQCLNHTDMTYAGNYYSPFSPDDNTTTDYSHLAKGYMVIDNYASTTKFKEYHTNFSWRFPGLSNQYVVDVKGTYKSTSAVTSIDVVNLGSACTFTNATNTSIRLYGIS